MTQPSPPKIVYIATREPSYSRVSIVRDALHGSFQVDDILSRQKDYPLRLLAIAFRCLWAWIRGRLRRADAVFVGFFAQPIFPLIRLLYRGPIIADAYFSIYDTLVFDKKKTRPGSLIAKICFWLDRTMLQRADLCFTDTEQHVEYFKSTFGVPNANVKRLWISAEQKVRGTRPPAPRLNEPLHVFFWGGFIPLQGVETIVRAAALLREDDVTFELYGSGQTMDECVALARQLGAENLTFAGWKSAREIEEAAEKTHLALGIFGSTDKAARVIPNKAFEALAMGIPLITRQSPAIEELLSDGRDVLLVPDSNPQQLAQQILWVFDHYDEALKIANRGNETFQRKASPAVVMQIICEEIQDLLGIERSPAAKKPLPAGDISNATPIEVHQEV